MRHTAVRVKNPRRAILSKRTTRSIVRHTPIRYNPPAPLQNKHKSTMKGPKDNRQSLAIGHRQEAYNTRKEVGIKFSNAKENVSFNSIQHSESPCCLCSSTIACCPSLFHRPKTFLSCSMTHKASQPTESALTIRPSLGSIINAYHLVEGWSCKTFFILPKSCIKTGNKFLI